MAKKPFVVKQSRSRESLQRLLNAAAEVLTERGLEGTTIPRIAARAGLSPGAVYRRFPNKDALLQTVVLTFLEENEERAKHFLESEQIQKMSLKSFAELVVKTSLAGQRKYAA